LGLAAAIRFALLALLWTWGLLPDAALAPDSPSYLEPAAGLWRHGSFSTAAGPEFIRTPGYPLLIALGEALGHPLAFTLLAQVGLALVTVAVAYCITRQLAPSRRIATIAALLFALEPLSLVYGAKILSETLFTALLAGHVCLLGRCLARPNPKHLAAAGLLLAAAAFTRPIALLLPVFELPLLAWLWRHEGRQAWLALLVFVGTWLAPPGAWVARNTMACGYPGFSGISDQSLYLYRAAAIASQVEGRPYLALQAEWAHAFDARHPAAAGWTPARRSLARRDEGLAVIRAHPGRYAANTAAGALRTVTLSAGVEGLRLVGMYPAAGGMLGRLVDEGVVGATRYAIRTFPVAVGVMVGLSLLLALEYLAAARGLVRAWRSPRARPLAMLLVLVGVGLVALGAGPESEPRFRHTVMVLLVPLAALGASSRPEAERSN
jgi:4-amino-4-deoxy-L-arabinose transferase-like glycosyltransferase